MQRGRPAQRILFATIGSLGDLHPCVALGSELRRRGHIVTVAAAEFYRERIEALGLSFRPLRPHWNPTDRELIQRCEVSRRGYEVLIRGLILPELGATCEDLLAAAAGQDLLLAGELVYAAPLVAEKLRMRWASLILSPCSFLSAHDPSLMSNVPELYWLRKGGPLVNRAALAMGRRLIGHWWRPVRDLRRAMNLRVTCDPIFSDKFSPNLVLALFSRHFAQHQPDWPSNAAQFGFAFHEESPDESDEAAQVAEFLRAGEPPIVFTQGSTAVHYPSSFFDVSAEAARRLDRRALLVGHSGSLTQGKVLAVPYVPYSVTFPHASVIVHQGGSGTTAQALRAGKPMLVVPFGWDQPDNGARVQRLGAGLWLPREKYTVESATAALKRLLAEPRFATAAGVLGERVQAEQGTTLACDAIAAIL